MTRTLYVTDSGLWESFQAYAEEKDISLGRMVERAMREHLTRDRDKCEQCEKIRKILGE